MEKSEIIKNNLKNLKNKFYNLLNYKILLYQTLIYIPKCMGWKHCKFWFSK